MSEPTSAALVDVVVPKWGMTMDIAVVTTWLRNVGDTVGLDDPIAELETDKALNDLPSPVAGTLVERLVDEGAEVEPGQAIARIRPET